MCVYLRRIVRAELRCEVGGNEIHSIIVAIGSPRVRADLIIGGGGECLIGRNEGG